MLFVFSHTLIYFYVLLLFSLVLFFAAYRINLCLLISPTLGSSLFLLLFFEPLSIAFETSQVLLPGSGFSFLADRHSVTDRKFLCRLS